MKTNDDTRKVAQGVLNYIEAHPALHNQDSWYNPPQSYYDQMDTLDPHGLYDNNVVVKALEPNICDTTMCVAGTAIFLNYGVKALVSPFDVLNESYSGAGAALLGLDDNEADWLFYVSDNDEAVAALEALAAGDEVGLKEIIRVSEAKELTAV